MSTVGYIVKHRLFSEATYREESDVGFTFRHRIDDLRGRTKYCFVVLSYDRYGALSEESDEVCATTPEAPPNPDPPKRKPPKKPGRKPTTFAVSTSTALQAALDDALPGDTIQLTPGVTYVGNFVLKAKTGSSEAYITIRSAAADSALPASGVRMRPEYSARLPKLQSPNSEPALSVEPRAHHYLLQFLEFLSNADGAGEIIALGDGSSNQNRLDSVPHHLILDRLYIHGDVTRGQERGIALNSASTRVLNSHIAEIKMRGGRSQAIAGWNGPGPWEITNNYLEAAGENVLIAGAPASIPDLVPADITLKRNQLTKQSIWRTGSWGVGDLLEVHSADAVVIDGNIFENVWAAWQSPFAVSFKSLMQNGAWSRVTNVEFTNNIVRNAVLGLHIADADAAGSPRISDISIRNNLFDRVTDPLFGPAVAFLVIKGSADVTVDHNTLLNDAAFGVAAVSPTTRLRFTNNVLVEWLSAVFGSGTVAGTISINEFFPSSEFRGSIFVGASEQYYPPLNFYPPTVDAVEFVNYAGGDYRLSRTSIYRSNGTDGKDPGCDFSALTAAQR